MKQLSSLWNVLQDCRFLRSFVKDFIRSLWLVNRAQGTPKMTSRMCFLAPLLTYSWRMIHLLRNCSNQCEALILLQFISLSNSSISLFFPFEFHYGYGACSSCKLGLLLYRWSRDVKCFIQLFNSRWEHTSSCIGTHAFWKHIIVC